MMNIDDIFKMGEKAEQDRFEEIKQDRKKILKELEKTATQDVLELVKLLLLAQLADITHPDKKSLTDEEINRIEKIINSLQGIEWLSNDD